MIAELERTPSVRYLPIIGMEPFLNKSSINTVRQIATYASERDIRVSCISNGSNFVRHLDSELAKTLSFIDVSLEGGPRTYPRSRRQPFRNFLENIKFASTQGVRNINLLITLSSENIESLGDIFEGVRQIEADTPIQKIWFSPFIPTANGRALTRMTLTREVVQALSRSNLFLKRDARQTRLVIDRYHREACRFLLKENIDDLWKTFNLDHSPELRERIWDQGDPLLDGKVVVMRHSGQILHPLESLHGIVAYRTFYINQEENSLKTVFSSFIEKNEEIINHFYPR